MTIDDCCWEVRWIAGPDAGGVVRLTAGRWLVGRAPQAHVRCDDPLLEPFHVELALWPHGAVEMCQLAGRRPVRRDGGRLTLGTSVLLVTPCEPTTMPGPSAPPTPGSGEQRVIRAPRHRQTWAPEPLPPPPVAEEVVRSGPSPSTVVSTGVGVLAAALVALVMGQPLLVLFAVVGAVAAMSAWAVEIGGSRRRQRRADAAHAAALADHHAARRRLDAAFAAHLRRSTLTVGDALDVVGGHGAGPPECRPLSSLWERRPADGDAFEVSLGRAGDIAPVDDLPVSLQLGPGARVALLGPHADCLVRALLVQLLVAAGPADWRLLVVSDSSDRWSWAATLPHLVRTTEGGHVFGDDALGDVLPADLASLHVLVVTDRPDSVVARSSALRRLVETAPSWALLVNVAGAPGPPALCTTAVATLADGRARLVRSGGPPPTEFRLAGIGTVTAARVARCLGRMLDPEVDPSGISDLVDTVRLDELLVCADPAELAAAWTASAHDPPLSAPIGVSASRPVTVDLVSDGPHALVAGTTGSGKSEFLRALVLGMAVSNSPDHLALVLVDFKGGAAFECCRALPHVTALVSDLEPALVDRLVSSLEAELVTRERLLRERGASDLAQLRALSARAVVPRVVVVVDEFAVLATEHPTSLRALLGVARRGRSLGVHLVLATQRPAGVVSDEIRANTDLRVALRLIDAADAVDVVGNPAPVSFPRRNPGRLLLRTGGDTGVVAQGARCADPVGLAGVVAAAGLLHRSGGLRHRSGGLRPETPRERWSLWTPPLPARLSPHDVGAGAVGLVDEPGHQRRSDLRWAPDDGHLMVVGAVGAGVTSTLITASVTVGDAVDLIVVDGLGDPRWDTVAMHSWCAGVVRPHERERLWRALGRAAAARRSAPCLLVIDGVHALRASLDAAERIDEAVMCDELLADPPAGLTLALGVDRVSGLPPAVSARCPNRWVLHLHDPLDSATLGVAPAPSGRSMVVPGRVRLTGNRVAQVVTAPLLPPPRRRSATPVVELPRRIEMLGIRPAAAGGLEPAGHDSWRTMVGLRADDLRPMELDVPDGAHLLVAGPPRSGRSTALAALMAAWTGSFPEGVAVVVAPRRSVLRPSGRHLDEAVAAVRADPARGRRRLLVVDDADAVADDDGQMTDLLAMADPELLVVASVRADSSRPAYGHWTGLVRAGRLGIVMSGSDELVAGMLGVSLPRRCPIAPRPGLAWVIVDGTATLAQLSVPGGQESPLVVPPAAYRCSR